MARSTRFAKLETRSARLKLPIAKKPIFVKIGPGVGLGYRRNRTAGTWVARVADGKGANWTKAIGAADDFEEANGTDVFDFWNAQERARSIGRLGAAGEGDDAKLATVEKALDRYEANLKLRSGDVDNVKRVRSHLTDALRQKTVALLNEHELRSWRDDLAKDMEPASVNRTTTILKATLNLAADTDARIPSRRPWEIGLATILGAEKSRNVVLPERIIRLIIVAAYEQSAEFGLLVETAAVTGARVSQLGRLEIQNVQGDRSDVRLMMPSSKKGRGKKKISLRPVPVTADLAKRLLRGTGDNPKNARLLVKPSGEAWKKSDHSRLFERAVNRVAKQEGVNLDDPKKAKLGDYEPSQVTIYALRHSNIVRQILANVPIRVVAAHHDTSVKMIEQNYSDYIGDHADALARGALFAVEPANDSAVEADAVSRTAMVA